MNKVRGILSCLGVVTLLNTLSIVVIHQKQHDTQDFVVLSRRDFKYQNLQKKIISNQKVDVYKRRQLRNITTTEYDMQLFSALLMNSSVGKMLDLIVVHAWIKWDPSIRKKWQEGIPRVLKFICCVRYRSGQLTVYYNIKRQHWIHHDRVEQSAWQLHCNISDRSLFDPPEEVTIRATTTNRKLLCPREKSLYVKTEFGFPPGGLAIYLKVLYSQLDANDLITWFEIHRLLGVDKVLAYVVDDLNKNAMKVLQYYQQQGFLDTIHFPLPGDVSVMHIDTAPCWNFKGLSFLDGHARLNSYKYIVSIDPDEYIVPTREETLKTLFDRLVKENPDAAGFVFKIYLFIKDWGVQKQSDFTIGRYLKRSEPTEDRIKHVVIPSRIPFGTARTLNFTGAEGYRRYKASVKDIAVYHFRKCRDSWNSENHGLDCYGMNKYTDTTVYNMFKTVETDAYRVKALCGV